MKDAFNYVMVRIFAGINVAVTYLKKDSIENEAGLNFRARFNQEIKNVSE